MGASSWRDGSPRRPIAVQTRWRFARPRRGALLAGRRSSFHGITQIHRKDKGPFREDLPRLFALLAERRIAPRIADRLPLLAARQAQARLEAGGVEGKIVLLAAR